MFKQRRRSFEKTVHGSQKWCQLVPASVGALFRRRLHKTHFDKSFCCKGGRLHKLQPIIGVGLGRRKQSIYRFRCEQSLQKVQSHNLGDNFNCSDKQKANHVEQKQKTNKQKIRDRNKCNKQVFWETSLRTCEQKKTNSFTFFLLYSLFSLVRAPSDVFFVINEILGQITIWWQIEKYFF